MVLQDHSEYAVPTNVLIVTPSSADVFCRRLMEILNKASTISVKVFQLGDDAPGTETLEAVYPGKITSEGADVIMIIDPSSPSGVTHSLVSAIKRNKPGMPVMIISDVVTAEEIMAYYKIGVSDCISPPLRAVDILPRVWRQIEYGRKSATLTHKLKNQIGLRQLVGKSPTFLHVAEKIPMIAQSDAGVLVMGETGTGKEMFARAIHYLGPRDGKPFLPVNCGTIPADLVENELFGHIKGAFTGAFESHAGLIQESNGGTLFLDEIDCLPLQAQAKLLRFLQEREYRQIGSSKVCRADVRVIAATNIDLDKAVQEGKFRQDLFYRLNIVRLTLPPLRERPGDVELLARHCLSESTGELGRPVKDFTSGALRKLSVYDWPGNVRELENIIKRAVIFSKGSMVQEEEIDLPAALYAVLPESFQAEKAKVVAEFEARYMREILDAHQGNITSAAKAAQKNRRAFWELIRKHNIDVRKFKPSSAAKQ